MMGGSYQQLNHGISTGALFLLVGLIYERRHTRLFKDYGGIKAQMPIYAALFLLIMLSSVGLPGLNGFIGEFLALMGAFEAGFFGGLGVRLPLVIVAATGVIFAAVYLLWMFQKVFYGPITSYANRRLKDLKPWEIAMVGTFVVLAVWGGIFPSTFLKPMEASIGATRMMALNKAGGRPVWKNLDTEMDTDGSLIQTSPRTQDQLSEKPIFARLLAPADSHPVLEVRAREALNGYRLAHTRLTPPAPPILRKAGAPPGGARPMRRGMLPQGAPSRPAPVTNPRRDTTRG
jgi:Proton-conducting membrane transporter